MSLLQRIKAALGLDGAPEPAGDDPVAVTVERDPKDAGEVDEDDDSGDTAGEPASTEDNVIDDEQVPPAQSVEPDGTLDEGTVEDNAVSNVTNDSVDRNEGTSGEPTESEFEPESESEPEPEPESEFEPESEPESESEFEPESEPEPEPDVETDPEPVTEISGIGPSYSERLAAAGIETVGELAIANPATVAADSDISETRISGWIEQAQKLVDGDTA